MSGSAQQPQPAAAHPLKSDLARFSLPQTSNESYRVFIWADAVCLLVVLTGLVGFYRPAHEIPPKKAETAQAIAEIKELRPDLIEEPPPAEQPPDAPLPADATPEPATAEAPPPIPVAEMTPAVQFSLPVLGPTTLVPVERAAAPSAAQARPATPEARPGQGTTPGTQGTYFRQSYGRGGMVKPKYPRALEQKGVSGEVLLLVTVDAEGRLVDVELEKRSGYREFDQEALRAARHPATHFNVPSAGKYSIPVLFDMSGKYQDEAK